jgi:hypothetical protein
MLFVALVLAGLGLVMIVGLVLLYLKIGALADELRDARAADAHALAVQLDALADKQQGTRHDLDRLTGELRTGHERIGALALHIEGPPSMRHPTLPPVSGAASTRRESATLAK